MSSQVSTDAPPESPRSSPEKSAPGSLQLREALPATWLIPGLVVVVSVIGFIIRAVNMDQGFIADELSTYWIIHGRGLRQVVDLVHSDAEITPPVYFVLGWFTSKLGSDPMWIRLPSLIAGSASIPLLYLLGARTVGRVAGLVGATVFALSPFMIYYAAEARAYSVMIFLLIVSTLALISGCETKRILWWAVYAAAICLTMLSHYTAIFYIGAQFLWAAWAHPTARKGLLIASAAAAVGFMPWLTGFIADNNSPTTVILDALQPFNIQAVKFATEQWAIGYPYVPIHSAPATVGVIFFVVAAAAVAAGIAYRAFAHRRAAGPGFRPRISRVPAGLVLIVLLALAAPVGEALASAVGTNLYGARNLDASWPGLALALGAAVVAAGPIAGVVALGALLGGYGVGASKALSPDFARTDYRGIARYVEDNSTPDNVILDGAALTPVPSTGLDVFLRPGYEEFRLDLPKSDMPFTVADPVPPPVGTTLQAFRRGRGRRLVVLAFLPTPVVRKGRPNADAAHQRVSEILDNPPFGFHEVARKKFPGIPRVAVILYDPPGVDGGTRDSPEVAAPGSG